MAETSGRELRRRREALGLELARIAELTAIPEDYLRALEADAVHRLPPGPYARSYARVLERTLGRLEQATPGGSDDPPTLGSDTGPILPDLPTGPVPTPDGEDGGPPSTPIIHTRPVPDEPPRAGRRVPLEVVRVLAITSTVAFAVLVAWQGAVEWQRWRSAPEVVGPEPVEVRLVLRANARLRVRIDDHLVAWRTFAGGEDVTFRGRERIEVDLPHARAARVWFGGRTVSPQGHLDRPRTLVFLHDRKRR